MRSSMVLMDWVYEEEFGIVIGFNWSPDGNRIAYYRFDESAKEYNLQLLALIHYIQLTIAL